MHDSGRGGVEEPPFSPIRASLAVALVYLGLGAAWILLSDWTVDALAPSEAWELRLQSIKGIFFVAASALLVGSMVYRMVRVRNRYYQGILQRDRLFKSIIDDTPDLICRYRPDGTIVHVNAAYRAYFNRTPADLIGTSIFALVIPEDHAKLKGLIASLSASTPVQSHEHRVVKDEDNTRWQRWTNQAIFDAEGTVSEIQAVGQDVTAEVEARQAREQALQALSDFMDAIPGNVIVAAPDGSVAFANRNAQNTFGGAATGSLNELFEADSAELIEEAARGIFEDSTPVRLSAVARASGRDPVELETVVFPVTGTDGEARVGLYAYDVTQSRALEQKLRSHTKRFESMFDLAGDGMAVFEILPDSALGRPTALNTSVERMLGYTKEELLGVSVPDLLTPVGQAQAAADFERLVQRGTLVGEYEFARKDGSTFSAEVSTKLFEEESGRFVFCVIRDLTARKEADRRLRESEERYRAIFDAAADSIFLVKGGLIVEANECAERMYGVGSGELEGRTILEFTPEYQPDGRRSEELFWDQDSALKDGQSLEFEWDHQRADKTPFTAWVRLQDAKIGAEHYTVAVIRDMTERIADQRRLRESEEELRKAQAIAQLGSWVSVVESGETLYVSAEMCSLFDTTPERMRAFEDRLSLVHPEDRERLAATFKGSKEGTYEIQYRAMVNGHLRWMHSRADIVQDPKLGGLVAHGTTQDITEVKLAQDKTIRAERQLDSILQSVPVGIGIVEDDVITWASAGLARITNRPVDSLLDGTLDTVLSVDAMAQLSQLRERADSEHPQLALQARLLTGDETRRWVQVNVAPLDRGDENADAYTISMSDITELREAEDRIRELSAAVENAPVSIFITDLDGTIRYANPHIERVTGYSIAEVVGENPRIFRSGETPVEVYADLWTTLASGQSWHGELLNRRKNGELFWEQATISPILRKDGSPYQYIAIKQDISQMKQSEEELRRYQDELEELVRERTAELLEARNVAQEADRMKSTFLASVSHELRTPLTSVIGFGEVLQEQAYGTLNEKQREYVDYILVSGNQLLGVINDILDLSRLDARRMELECKSFTLPALIAQCVESVAQATIPRNIEVIQEIDQNLWLSGVVADERKLRQVFLNLLSNAAKFTPDFGKITVSANVDSDAIRIDVTDTGQGIPPEHLDSIFETFRQLNEDEHHHSRGTGLGLALTRRMVELHGGRVWAESEGLGRGSTFVVELPLRTQSVNGIPAR